MRHITHTFAAAIVAGLVVLAPARASADIFAMPFAGLTFLDEDFRKTTFGASVGAGVGPIAVEFDAARTVLGSYTDLPGIDLSARVTTYMGNLILRLPAGPIRPYVTGGGGIVRLTGSVDVPFLGSIFSASAEDFGWNFGGGLMIFPVSNLGLRADVRRIQTGDLEWDEITDTEGLEDLPLPKADFWRATAGLTFRF